MEKKNKIVNNLLGQNIFDEVNISKFLDKELLLINDDSFIKNIDINSLIDYWNEHLDDFE